MFSKILKKKEESASDELVQRVSKMNLTDMRIYVNNRLQDFEITEDGLVEVLKRLTTKDEDTLEGYLKEDDMDVKIKKGFDLVITICTNIKITIEAVDLVQQFITMYASLIEKYDTEHKEIYQSRLVASFNKAISNYEDLENIKRKIIVTESVKNSVSATISNT